MKTSVRYRLSAAAGLAGFIFASPVASAQESYVGELKEFAGNYCPRGTLEADGQLLKISEHTALFSLLGTIYGGDGRTTFALPDLSQDHYTSQAQAGNDAEAFVGDWAKLKSCIVEYGIYPGRN